MNGTVGESPGVPLNLDGRCTRSTHPTKTDRGPIAIAERLLADRRSQVVVVSMVRAAMAPVGRGDETLPCGREVVITL